MCGHWEKLIRDAEARTHYFLTVQGMDGSVEMDFRYPDPKPTISNAACALSLYLNGDSRFYGDASVLDAVEKAIGYIEGCLNKDGTFDFTPCNFRSAPDTAFIVNRMVTTRDLIEARRSGEVESERLLRIRKRLDNIIYRAAEGMTAGGFHTPNHRWALAAALSSCARICGNDRFRTAAERYLAEGIDGNADGEYAERSAGNYNMVNNDQMITLSEERKDPLFLEYVQRNLFMMLNYVEPDGSIFTNNSTRQDRGKKVYLDQYYFNYLYVGAKLNNTTLTAVARRIMDDIVIAGRESPDFLDRIMLHFGGVDYGMVGETEAAAAIPVKTEKFYRDSGIVRVRRKNFSFSLLRGTGRFLYASSGAVTASFKLGISYFDKREAVPTSLEKEGDTYVLRSELKGWYYLPFGKYVGTVDWWKMDNASRKKLLGPDLVVTVRVRLLAEEEGLVLELSAEGWKGVPVRFEFGLNADSWVEANGFALRGTGGGAILIKEGNVRFRIGIDVLEIGPCFGEHQDISGTYGSEERSPDHFTIYSTTFTPFRRILTLKRVQPKRS